MGAKEEKELSEKWQEYKNSAMAKTWESLEFQYGKKEKEARGMAVLIVEALTFWKFIFKLLPWDNKNLAPIVWIKRQEALAVFAGDANLFIGIIARIESLPTMVWRKILWKHNIDFMSFESFLRRISINQMRVITENYYDLYVAQVVPQAFSRWDRFWNKISMEKIFSESFNYGERYCNKGAMSYNLLGLDFGFNAYPKGITDDERVVEISPLKFLSVKNHADDFVVNQEAGGKYWWLYKTARSNYVLEPNRDVHLKTHICPGFWYTILVHLFFWIISPLIFTSLVAVIAAKPFHAISWWTIGVLGIPGLITPLWAFAALVKRVVDSDGFWWLKKFLDHHENFLKTSLVVGILVVALIVFGNILWEFYKFLKIGLGLLWSILVVVAASVYVGYKIYFKSVKSNYSQLPKFSEYPWYFRIPLLFFVVVLPIEHSHAVIQAIMFVLWAVMRGLNIIIDFCVQIWRYLIMMGPLAMIIVLYFIFAGLIWHITTLDEKKQEKLFNRFEKVMRYVVYLVWATIALLLIVPLKLFLNLQHSQEFYFVLFLVSGLVFGIQRAIAQSFKPSVKENKEIAKNIVISDHNEISYKLILKNPWLRTLDLDTKYGVLFKVRRVVKYLFGDSYYVQMAPGVLIPIMTKEILDAIEANIELIVCRNQKEMRFKIFKQMALGHSYDMAVILAEKKQKTEEAVKKVFKKAFSPFILLWQVVKMIYRVALKLGELAKTFYRLYKLFNERCPFVVQKRVLTIE